MRDNNYMGRLRSESNLIAPRLRRRSRVLNTNETFLVDDRKVCSQRQLPRGMSGGRAAHFGSYEAKRRIWSCLRAFEHLGKSMAKRWLDVAVGVVLCLIAVPVILVGALITMAALRTTSPFFVQFRVGRDGRVLRFPKLRTMPRSIPAYALKTSLCFETLPKAMKFIRKMHIDELPQLLLVLTGALSLVGPRPKMPDLVEPVDEHYRRVRLSVPQGCTGLWQISVHKKDLPSDFPKYDYFYVEHQSLRFDLWILWRTFAHGVGLTPLVTLEDVPGWVCAHRSIEHCRLAARHASVPFELAAPALELTQINAGAPIHTPATPQLGALTT